MQKQQISKIVFSIFWIILLFANTSCTKKIYDVVYPTLNDGRYDSEFPYKNASHQLEEISKSIKNESLLSSRVLLTIPLVIIL